MDNPVGGIKRGRPAIRAVYENIFNSDARVKMELYDYPSIRGARSLTPSVANAITGDRAQLN